MSNKKVIIWDFDGPIIDSRELALELTQFEFHDVDEQVHRDLFSENIFEAISKLKKKDNTEEESAAYHTGYALRKAELPSAPGIEKVIEDLSQDYVMVINSSSGLELITAWLEKRDLLKFFKKIYGKEIKSKVEKFNLLLKEYGVGPNDCVLITDTLGDVLEAQKLGISSIVVLWGYQTRSHFDPVKDEVAFVEKPSGLPETVRNFLV